MQTDPVDDATLLDGTGSLVTYLAVSGTIDAFYFKGDGSQLTGIVSSKWTGSNPISRQSDVEITGSLRVTGGVTASYAMLGDFNISEPGALIGFAGPRVIKETIGKELPKGFQTAEFVLEHGFLDFIVDRKDLKDKLASLLRMLQQ